MSLCILSGRVETGGWNVRNFLPSGGAWGLSRRRILPSPPSPSACHFQAVVADVEADVRLSAAKRRLLVRTVRRARADFMMAPDPVKQLMSVWLRAYWQVLAAPPDAATTLRAVDGFVRLGRQLGFLTPDMLRRRPGSWAMRHKVRPPIRTHEDMSEG